MKPKLAPKCLPKEQGMSLGMPSAEALCHRRSHLVRFSPGNSTSIIVFSEFVALSGQTVFLHHGGEGLLGRKVFLFNLNVFSFHSTSIFSFLSHFIVFRAVSFTASAFGCLGQCWLSHRPSPSV